MSPGRALVERSLARMVSRRVILACGLCAFLVLLFTGVGLAQWLMAQELPAADQPAALRLTGWSKARGFFDLFMWILAITLGCGQIAGDVRDGTIFSFLARPVPRRTILLAGWTASALVLLALEAARQLLMTGFYLLLGGSLDAGCLLGATSVMLDHLLTLTLFVSLGTMLPAALACVAGVVCLALPALVQAPFVKGAGRLALQIVSAPFPSWAWSSSVETVALQGGDFSLFDLLEVHAYRGAWIVLLLIAGAWLFSRRELAPRI